MIEQANPTYVQSKVETLEVSTNHTMKKGISFVPFILLAIFAIISIFVPLATDFDGASTYNFADVSWLLISSALVLLMTPGLSFFYGGMVSKKNVISTMLQSFIATGLISAIWVV